MRPSAVLSSFLKGFARNYPQLSFKGMRQLRDDVLPPYQLVLRLAPGHEQREYDLYIVALGSAHPDDLRPMLAQLGPLPAPDDGREALRVLLVPHLDDQARALCVAAGVSALDLAGNAQLEGQGLYVQVTGRAYAYGRKHDTSGAFRGKAERVTRQLLLSRDRQWTMRELASAADVSLGLASMATTTLAGLGLVTKSRQGLLAHDPTSLLDAWAEAYDLRKSPFVIYRSPLDVPTIEARLGTQPADTYALTLWSAYRRLLGESARERYVALFWARPMAEVEELLALSRHTGHTYLFIFQPYDPCLLWGAQPDESGVVSVSPLQLYLDLGSGDEQELALARRVREQVLGY